MMWRHGPGRQSILPGILPPGPPRRGAGILAVPSMAFWHSRHPCERSPWLAMRERANGIQGRLGIAADVRGPARPVPGSRPRAMPGLRQLGNGRLEGLAQAAVRVGERGLCRQGDIAVRRSSSDRSDRRRLSRRAETIWTPDRDRAELTDRLLAYP